MLMCNTDTCDGADIDSRYTVSHGSTGWGHWGVSNCFQKDQRVELVQHSLVLKYYCSFSSIPILFLQHVSSSGTPDAVDWDCLGEMQSQRFETLIHEPQHVTTTVACA